MDVSNDTVTLQQIETNNDHHLNRVVNEPCSSCPKSPIHSEDEETLLQRAENALNDTTDYLRSTLLTRDPQLLSGLIKWGKHIKNMPLGRLSSALHCFHKYDAQAILKQKRTTTTKIKVLNPSRRVVPSGSKQKVSKGNRRQDQLMIPNKTMITGTKRHNLTNLVKDNSQMPKKRSRMMQSRHRTSIQKAIKTIHSKSKK